MVAIALYRGNLHRIPNAPPRRWPVPSRSISVRQFKSLVRRRSVAISRLVDSSSDSALKKESEDEARADDSNMKVDVVDEKIAVEEKDEIEEMEEEEEKKNEQIDLKNEPDAGTGDGTQEKSNPYVKEEVTETETGTITTEKDERKTELEKKLEKLNQKKHNLVQMLKQILNAEEELKRRSVQSPLPRWTAQGPFENGSGPSDPNAAHGPDPLKLNIDVHFGNDLCGESDPGSTHSAPARPFSRSPLVNNQRGQFGHAMSLPPLLPLPGNNYVASSSPAGSGGTSVFRDSRFSGGPN